MKSLSGLILTVLALVSIGLHSANAEASLQNASSIQCSINDYCDVRLSYSGQTYVFKSLSKMLYISDINGTGYQTYDLSGYADQLTGIFDVVLFDEIGIVAFDSEDIHGRGIRLYNLATGQLQTLNLYRAGDGGRIIQCNRWRHLRYLPNNFIMRLGDQNQLLFCAFTSDKKFVANILDITTQSVLQTIDFDNGASWIALVAGLDGNIYVETTTSPVAPILVTTLADAGGAASSMRLIFKFSPQITNWSVNKIPFQERFTQTQFYIPPVTPIVISELIAVDTLGRYYFYQAWDDSEHVSRTEVRGLSPSFEQVALMTDLDFGGPGVLSSISGEGQLLFRLGNSIEDMRIVNADDYFISIVTPTPTPMETPTYTLTSTNTATIAPTDTLTSTDTATNTPIPTPGTIVVQITVPAADGSTITTTDQTRFQATAHDTAAGTSDGAGIQQVAFEIDDPSGTLIFSASDNTAPFCTFGGDTPCNAAPSNPNAIQGNYTFRARAQNTADIWSEWVTRTFIIGTASTNTPTITNTPTDTPDVTATNIPAVTSTPISGGAQIVFTSERDGNTEIYVMNSDGSSPTRLTNDSGTDIYPFWSPDHSHIYFASTRGGAGLDVYVMNADGSTVTRLTSNSGDDYAANLSPDGSKITFVSTRDGNLEIYVMNADGSGQTRLTNNSAIDSIPTWSPDGSRIGFVTDRDGNLELYTMNADGTNVTRLTNNGAAEFGPAWSPDGSQIAFATSRDGNLEVYTMNADGSGTPTRLTNTSAFDGYAVVNNVAYYGLAWSPDETQLVFISNRDGNVEIYRMNADGSGQTRLTNATGSDSFPNW